MSVAIFLYQEIYCRYLSPGEAIIYDRGGEFTGKVVKNLNESFGVDMRVISAGRPQGNGQAEAMVKTMKNDTFNPGTVWSVAGLWAFGLLVIVANLHCAL